MDTFSSNIKGIGGNVFGTLSTPDAISVGSGGCIFGILGALHVDMIHSIIEANFHKEQSNCNSDEEDGDSDSESDDPEEDSFIFYSTFIVLGFLGGIVITTVMGVISPTSSRFAKDWSVLYGGMISGMITGLLWHLCSSLIIKEEKSKRGGFRVIYALVVVIVPFLLDCFLSLQVTKGN